MLFTPGRIILMLASLLVVMGKTPVSAHGVGTPSLESPYAIPPLVRLTGTLVPTGEKKDDGLDTLGVSMGGKEWTFKLTDVETLSGTNYGPMILNDLFPREVRFMGPDQLLRPIQEAAGAQEPIAVEGRLYLVDRNFVVTAAGSPEAKSE
jgi:hypothetical protein